MTLADLLRETLDVDCEDVWENERTPNTLTGVGVRLHSMGLSLREVVAVLELLGIDRSHGAVWNWTHTLSDEQSDPPTASPSRVAVDEKQIEVDGGESGCTQRSTRIRGYCWSSTSTAAAGPTPRRRSCIDSPRNTTFRMRRFWSMLAGI